MDVDQLVQELNEIKLSVAKISKTLPDIEYFKINIVNSHSDLVKFTKKHIENRALRQKMIHPTVFSDPSWDILVELFYARLIGRTEYISSISVAGGTPPSTGLRHICVLEEMGFLTRTNHPDDRRRVNLCISDQAYEIVRDFFVRTSRN
jgi:DNA-binding MarR family transcriptional regulator